MISFSVISPFLTTAAVTASPKSSWGTPKTADSSILSKSSKIYSISLGYTFNPPDIIMSLDLPTIDTYPSSSIDAISPVIKKPSSVNSSLVF
jgi:hypothetical protein